MAIHLTIFSDFVCPFCYVGSGIIDKLSNEFDLDVTWIGYELHPETPPEGVLLTERYDPFDIDQVMFECRRRGEPYGVVFGEAGWLSNTRLALEAAAFAKDAGQYDCLHHALFKASFTEGRNLSDRQVILDVAGACGLDTDALNQALDESSYGERVAEGSREAARRGVKAIPCFFIEDQPPLVGAVEERVFRERLQAATDGVKV